MPKVKNCTKYKSWHKGNFYGCSLSAAYLGSEPPVARSGYYEDKPILKNNGILYVPIGCKATYVANGWGEYNIEEYDINDPYGSYENAIYVKDDVLRTGTTATLPIYMKNKEAATGYEFSIILPQGINASDVVLKKSTARKADEMSFSSALQADGTIKVICYSTDGQPFAGNDGEIATLTMPIPDDLKAGDYPLLIDKIEITNNGKATVVYDQLYTNLTVKDYFLGDANCDKRVSVSDLSIIVNHILNVNIDPEAPYNALAADANEDERISVSDLSAIVNIILYGNPDGPSEGKARDEEDTQSFLFSAPAFTINPGEESTLYLQLANSVDVTAFQFDAILPEGLTCTQAKRVAARVGEEHSFQSSLMDEQNRRVVCYSSTNANIEGNEGAIVELTIKAADNLQPGLYTLSLEGLEVVCHNQGMTLDNVALSIEIVDADGIEELQQDQTVKTRYDLMGRSSTRPQHGIYFENGRKVMVK